MTDLKKEEEQAQSQKPPVPETPPAPEEPTASQVPPIPETPPIPEVPITPEASTAPESSTVIEQNEQSTLGSGNVSQDKTSIENKKKIPTNVTIVLVGSLVLFVVLLFVGLYAFKNKNLSQDSVVNGESNQGDIDSSETINPETDPKDGFIGLGVESRNKNKVNDGSGYKRPISFNNRQYVFDPESREVDEDYNIYREKYEYRWEGQIRRDDEDEPRDDVFFVSITNRTAYDSEGMRDFGKGFLLAEDKDNDVVIREWQDEANDEYILYVSFSDFPDKDQFVHHFIYFSNDGKFDAHVYVTSREEYTEEQIDFMISEFRKAASMAKKDSPDIPTYEISDEAESMYSAVRFHFDQDNFVYDSDSVFYEGGTTMLYSLKEESRKSFKKKVMMIRDSSNDSGEDFCEKQLKDPSDDEISNFNFRGPGECDFFTEEDFDYGDDYYVRYSWVKVTDRGDYTYVYTVTKKSSDKLPFYVIDKITDEFRQFEYKERF